MDLQKFDHRSSGYDRQDDWICGHAADGRPCRLGPDSSGACRTTRECVPASRGERWVCTRPGSLGGPCEGPMPDGSCSQVVVPCTPIPTRKKRQASLGTWMLIVAGGLALLLFGAWQTRAWISPGPLSHAHAEIESCRECHDGFEAGPVSWLALAFGTADDPSPRCVNCHYRTEHPFQPHSASPGVLARLTGEKDPESGPVTLAVAAMLTDERPPIRCTSCHQEHHGRASKLVEIADGACQSCHVARFESFSKGHPDFEMYPADHRTHIVFDHRAHLEKHFDEEGRRKLAPVGCVGCHVVESSGERMDVVPFRQTCAACHLGQVDGDERPAGTRAIAVLTAPGLDLWTLEEKGYDVGQWPRLSDRPITPFMSLVLGRDPETKRDLEMLAEVDLLDLEDADAATLEAVTRLARSIKELYWDLERRGPDILTDRLDPDGEMERTDLSSLLASLPRSAIGGANAAWFQGLDDDVRRFRSGAPLRTKQRGARAPETSPGPSAPAAGNDDRLAGDDDLLAGGDDLLSSDDDDDLLRGDDDLLSGDDDLLAGGDDLLSGGDDLLAGDDDLLADDSAADEEEVDRIEEPDPPIDSEEWAKLGGWFRDQEALFYRPVGHPDRFLQAWLTMAPRFAGDDAAAKIFEDLTRNKPPGACTKCHSVDATGDGVVVRWLPGHLAETTRGFTSFAHAPHFSLMGNRGCVSCHQLAETGDYLSGYEQRDPEEFTPGFEQIELEDCERCHNARADLQSCTLCHNYHVGVSRQPPRL